MTVAPPAFVSIVSSLPSSEPGSWLWWNWSFPPPPSPVPA